MSKSELIAAVARKLRSEGISRAAAERQVNAMLEALVEGLQDDGGVTISGFGRFTLARRAPRPGRNPKTGESIPIEPAPVIRFKASRLLLERFETPEA